jgi:hypothetical protein
VPVNRTTPKKTTASKATAGKTTAKTSVGGTKATTNLPQRASGRSPAAPRRGSTSAMPARPGDLIIVDSPKVGTPPREGEILKVTVGDFSVSYQVRWGDGHETTISPGAGTARIVRS